MNLYLIENPSSLNEKLVLFINNSNQISRRLSHSNSHRHKPTLNIQKQAYKALLFAQLDFATSLLKNLAKTELASSAYYVINQNSRSIKSRSLGALYSRDVRSGGHLMCLIDDNCRCYRVSAAAAEAR